MKSVDPEPPSDLELEILDTLWSCDRETVATVFPDLSDPDNVDRFSAAAKGLDRADLDAVFHRLRDPGLVVGHEEPSDGCEMEPGRTYTWWSMTAEGRRVWAAWDDANDGIDSAALDGLLDGAETIHTTRPKAPERAPTPEA